MRTSLALRLIASAGIASAEYTAVVNALRPGEPALDTAAAAARGLIEYIPFPDALRGKYQCYTQADLTALRAIGCSHAFSDVQTGVASYMADLSTASQSADR